jgi:hypothetical protein
MSTHMRWAVSSLWGLTVLVGCSFAGNGMGADDGDDVPPPPGRYASCLDALAQGATTSGVYDVDPADGGAAFAAYCDQDTDGGGWTLALKADGDLPTFGYDQPVWTTGDTYAAGFPDRDRVEAKLASFARLRADEILVEVDDHRGVRRLQADMIQDFTLLERFASNLPELFGMPGAWTALVPGEVPRCLTLDGVNIRDREYRARLGLVARDYDDFPACEDDPTAIIGVGLAVDDRCEGGEDAAISVGHVYDGCDDDATSAFAWVYVR